MDKVVHLLLCRPQLLAGDLYVGSQGIIMALDWLRLEYGVEELLHLRTFACIKARTTSVDVSSAFVLSASTLIVSRASAIRSS